MWKTTNYKGEEQIWYSKEEIEKKDKEYENNNSNITDDNISTNNCVYIPYSKQIG